MGTNLKITKAIQDKLTENIILNSEKLKSFLLRSGTRQRCLFLPILFSIVLTVEILSRSIRQGKKKGIQIRTEETKQSLFSDDRVLYI